MPQQSQRYNIVHFVEVMNAAMETRGDPPSEDPEWFKENALLDFLLFISKGSHRGLFAPVETGGCGCASRYLFGGYS